MTESVGRAVGHVGPELNVELEGAGIRHPIRIDRHLVAEPRAPDMHVGDWPRLRAQEIIGQGLPLARYDILQRVENVHASVGDVGELNPLGRGRVGRNCGIPVGQDGRGQRSERDGGEGENQGNMVLLALHELNSGFERHAGRLSWIARGAPGLVEDCIYVVVALTTEGRRPHC